MSGVDPAGQFPNSFMARAVHDRHGRSVALESEAVSLIFRADTTHLTADTAQITADYAQ